MKALRVVTIFGTRPEFIRLSSLSRQLDLHFNHFLVNTSQNSHPNLSDVFFDELQIRTPDITLEPSHGSIGEDLARIFRGVDEALTEIRPDAAVVLGDTNSSLSALLCERRGIPVFHLEAGNRAFDSRVPEELNRKAVDCVSTYNLPYTEYAKSNLLREGQHPNNLCVTGSPIPEVIASTMQSASSSQILARLDLREGEFFLLSSHRQETVDNEENLGKLVDSVNQLAISSQLPVIVSAHPRLRSKLEGAGAQLAANVRLLSPFGFLDYLTLQANAKFTFSDSGSLPEEAAVLRTPAAIIRNSFERQESLEAGFIGMAGLEFESWKAAMDFRLGNSSEDYPWEYETLDFSKRVLNFMLTKLSTRNIR